MTAPRRAALLAAVALAAVASSCAGSASTPEHDAAREAKPKPGRLVAFRSCGELLQYAKAQAARFVGPWGLGGMGGIADDVLAAGAESARTSAPQQGVDFSGTNVQEEGVDEPDLVKTDGRTVFAVANGMLNAVDVRTPRPRLLDTLKLDDGWSYELLLHRDRLLVLSRGGFWLEPLPAMAARIAPYAPSESVLTEVDVSDPSALRVVRTLTLDGSYVAARLVGRSVRVVASSQVPGPLPFEQPQGESEAALATATDRNRSVVADSGLRSWLPRYRVRRGGVTTADRPLVQCRQVRRTPSFSGLGMLTVLTIDLTKGLQPTDSVSVMTDARIVYASPESLYVATERWADRPAPEQPTTEKDGVTTSIHKFDISSPTRTLYRGSGRVAGHLLSQWSLSEHDDVLRVVSTERPAWWGPGGGTSESFLTTLRPQDGGLVQVGRVGGLGKGEQVYAVRFVGDVGYVVTFRQVDPLYTLDLGDPARPRVLGELKIPGYSAYLHPIGDELVLGVGQDADEQGRPLGTQISIFDVSDLRRPTRLHTTRLGQGWSEAENDHHAFLYWARTGLVVVPFNQEAIGFHVGRRTGIDRVGRIEHEAGQLQWLPQIRRSLVAAGSVLTVSDAGLKSSSLGTLAEQGWATFPAPPAPPVEPDRPVEPVPPPSRP